MRAAQGTAMVAAAGICLAGCGTSDRDLVQAKVRQFVQAAARRQYRTICTQVLAPELLGHLVERGIGCEQAMQVALANVHSPSLALGRVTVRGRLASVLVITGARGQYATLTAIQLVKTAGGWRVAGLGSPVAPPAASVG
ncbi:MAG: hypothetical protein ACYC91_14955 [Solirubrobacteraceae bacterium]